MAIRVDIGWQSEKTLSECMRYMFDNEIATDVCFEVGPVIIRAHKYMLTSRSPVFEAMFSSGMTECRSGSMANIRVEDIDADIFRQLLIYIYGEIVSVSVKTATSLMYAAKKYMLPKLVRACRKCLSEGLDVNNVIHVLEKSILFDETELMSKCLELIALNAQSVLTGADILSASPQTMEAILLMDNMPIKEIVVYETCLAWAKFQLQLNGSTGIPTDQQMREILGDLLFNIRFPTMELSQFAAISESKNLLTEKEKLSVYHYLATHKKASQLMFSSKQRHREEIWIDRTVACAAGPWGGSRLDVDAIDFTTSRNMLLTGIGLYSGFDEKGYVVDIEVMQSTTCLTRKTVKVPRTKKSDPLKVSLDQPIFIKAGVLHSVKTWSFANIGFYSKVCQAICKKGNVTITFTTTPGTTGTDATRGQIPRLYFL